MSNLLQQIQVKSLNPYHLLNKPKEQITAPLLPVKEAILVEASTQNSTRKYTRKIPTSINVRSPQCSNNLIF